MDAQRIKELEVKVSKLRKENFDLARISMEKNLILIKRKKNMSKNPPPIETAHSGFSDKKKDDEEHDNKLWSAPGSGKQTGNYELVGVVTHKGRSSDSGHYVSWIQEKGDAWLKFDDEVVTNVTIDDVLNLKGGGDWHMAYYLIYRRLELKS